MTVHTEIEIAASPSQVREVFLNFPKIVEWHSGLVKSISLLAKDEVIKKGSKLDCDMEGFHFVSTVKENAPGLFQWQSPPIHGIVALHSFRFRPSKTTLGWTTFVQDEEYRGLLAFIMSPSLGGKKIQRQFEGFNKDIKARVEGLYTAG